MSARLVVGLGNPGSEYAGTRHNVGFRVVDRVAEACGATWQRKFRGVVARVRLSGEEAWLLKPETYMNLSGAAVAEAVRFFKLGASDWVVVHDDMELEFGRVQVKDGGGHGGHNGLRSIEAVLGGGFGRVRCGIGRPPADWDPADFVLSRLREDERVGWEEMISRAAEAARVFGEKGLVAAMNRTNRSRPRKASE
ncbi:MAG: aminoacyl-tRNA hydrolase [Deltaproteobacteria bacterium]|nr:aminoacyl-tRNA hydrolase [Deltaproteobacteria bacterium]